MQHYSLLIAHKQSLHPFDYRLTQMWQLFELNIFAKLKGNTRTNACVHTHTHSY